MTEEQSLILASEYPELNEFGEDLHEGIKAPQPIDWSDANTNYKIAHIVTICGRRLRDGNTRRPIAFETFEGWKKYTNSFSESKPYFGLEIGYVPSRMIR